MYRKYHTKGFVLDSFNLGESNKLFLIFTRKLGLLKASARSVRELKSKLRYGLTNYTLGNFTVIKSKSGWKITGAAPLSNIYFNFSDFQKKVSFLKVLTLIKKLVPEEEPNPLLFDMLSEAFDCFLNNQLEEKQSQNLECLTVLRILKILGYLNYQSDWRFLLETSELSTSVLDQFSPFRKKAVTLINQSLKESQLM